MRKFSKLMRDTQGNSFFGILSGISLYLNCSTFGLRTLFAFIFIVSFQYNLAFELFCFYCIFVFIIPDYNKLYDSFFNDISSSYVSGDGTEEHF